jgi:sporulation protein YlmC with PRC-barrel domain
VVPRRGATRGLSRNNPELVQLKERVMRRRNILIAASLALMTPGLAQAQVAGSTVLGVAAAELQEVATGWSAKRQVLGRPVFNDKNEKVGTVDDIIISPDKAVSYAIVGAGGFLGVATHDVAIPVNQFTQADGKLVLAGATKEAIKAMPPFEYARR